MAAQLTLYLLLLLASQSSFVHGRNDFFHHFHSHNKRGSTTVSVSSISTQGSSPTDELLPSTSDQSESNQKKNGTVQEYDPYYPDDYYNRSNDVGQVVAIIMGSIIGVSFFVGCCLFFCCASCRKPQEQRGYIIRSNAQIISNASSTQQIPQFHGAPTQYATQRNPYTQQIQQVLYAQQSQQTPTYQHAPPENKLSDFPPPYDTQAVQPQLQQYSPANVQQHNSPVQPERQYPAVSQQMPTGQLVNLGTNPTAPQGYEKF